MHKVGRFDPAALAPHPIYEGHAEGPAMMKLRAVVLPSGVAMRINVDQAHGFLAAKRLQDGIGNRMVTAQNERDKVMVHDQRSRFFDRLSMFISFFFPLMP